MSFKRYVSNGKNKTNNTMYRQTSLFECLWRMLKKNRNNNMQRDASGGIGSDTESESWMQRGNGFWWRVGSKNNCGASRIRGKTA